MLMPEKHDKNFSNFSPPDCSSGRLESRPPCLVFSFSDLTTRSKFSSWPFSHDRLSPSEQLQKWFLFKLKLKPWIFCVETWKLPFFISLVPFSQKLFTLKLLLSDVQKLFLCFLMFHISPRLNSPPSSTTFSS